MQHRKYNKAFLSISLCCFICLILVIGQTKNIKTFKTQKNEFKYMDSIEDQGVIESQENQTTEIVSSETASSEEFSSTTEAISSEVVSSKSTEDSTKSTEKVPAAPKESKMYGTTTVLSESDYEILAKLLYCEARGMSIKGQIYTCSAIINYCELQGISIWEGAHTKRMFSPAPFVDTVTPTQTQYDVINRVLSGERVAEICYFREGHYHNFGTPVCNVENHYFSKP